MRAFALEGRIEPQQLIKVAQRINYDLGLRVSQTKEKVLELDHGKVRLPENFHVMNFGLICGKFEIDVAIPQGTHVEDCEVPPFNQNTPNNPFVPVYKDPHDPRVCEPDPEPLFCHPTKLRNTTTPACLTKCGKEYKLIQIVHSRREVCHVFSPIKFVNATDPKRHSHRHFSEHEQSWDNNSAGIFRHTGDHHQAWLKDGFLWTNLECGHVYINYMGDMTNEDDELMVPDHAYINEYMEYGLKQRILENLAMDGIDVKMQMSIVEPRYKAARNTALGFVNMPNFSELQHTWALNRKAHYNKYYQMFESYPSWGSNLTVGNQV